ncbi:hypothetical protein CO038_04820 [Candidatus Pacearchaeota archaeon CG_4_9_14_0_2_um_filter_39_13]|nr:hypothetical protein [Candidatus Pacearchaeota archaeon]OIO43845.1 MAG: hypothetical protein AUJ64_01605 [Candidatus Pacearchaeota archaeon CG1_02_39_14]PJC44218.1 MAG: hypothetical protein CO038_04820 [Candidatus Pacearchaeota archaeon CG_4_9_14_0_2_um_filter_39_13]
MNKRGQFFIIAAIIIVSAISGLTGIANYAEVSDDQRAFYDLSEEVGFESKKVLDWGVFNEEDVGKLTESFLANYSDYIGQEEVIFIFGDKDNVNFNALIYREEGIGSVGLNTGNNRNIEINRKTGRTADVDLIFGNEERVIVSINEISYDFGLREGQNFFFVIIKEEENERFVAKG